MGYFQVMYDSRDINYDRRGFIILATGLWAHFFVIKHISDIFTYRGWMLVIYNNGSGCFRL